MAADSRLNRSPRASRRRPDTPPPEVERIRPWSGLSRDEVVANQRSRIFDGFAAALAYHGYEDTKVTDIVELAGISRATFYERFESKELCFAAGFEDGVERLKVAIEEGIAGEGEWAARLDVGLRVALAFFVARPELANLLLVESLAAARPARLEYERSLQRLAHALRPPPGLRDAAPVPDETARILAGGLASRISGCLLADEAERLPDLHGPLLAYLLTPYRTAVSRPAEEQRAARA